MTFPSRQLTVLAGGADDPLRAGVCRRSGCADPVVELGLCGPHLEGYHRARGRREQVLARRTAANFGALVEAAGDEGSGGVEREWLWALGEHLAAHGIEPSSARGDGGLREAVLDALADYVDEGAGRGHLTVVA
jgi:hypothetical protein